MLEYLLGLDLQSIVAISATAISLGLAIWKAIQSKSYAEALNKAGELRDSLLLLVDKFKVITPAPERKPVLKEFGKILEEAGEKENIDKRLDDLGLSNKS